MNLFVFTQTECLAERYAETSDFKLYNNKTEYDCQRSTTNDDLTNVFCIILALAIVDRVLINSAGDKIHCIQCIIRTEMLSRGAHRNRKQNRN